MRTAAEVLVLLGALVCLVGALGALRFRDVYSRMHAAGMVPTLGMLLVIGGAALVVDGTPRVTLLVAAVLQLFTAPVSAHLLGRAEHRHGGRHGTVEGTDELARDERTAPQGE